MKYRLDCAWVGFILAILLCIKIYSPGLQGSYLFDDFPNIVDNTDVHVGTLAPKVWLRAVLASPASELRRPLSMFSFTVNEYFTGNNPFPMKATNLSIHLLNGLLLFLMLKELLWLWRYCHSLQYSDARLDWIAAAIASAWILAPINLTSVLYVVQRMESLAQTFVLLGLWRYLHARHGQIYGRGSWFQLFTILVLCTVAGVLCKETAILLPLYAFALEWTLLRFNGANPAIKGRLTLLYTIVLFVPTLIGLAWILPKIFASDAYSNRPFTLIQRLLTEPRIVTHYIQWTLLPLPEQMSFYHDDIGLSHGLLTPPSTIVCVVLLAALLGIALWSRKRLALVSLGLFWFFAAQSLTATAIPLELVFEHRNYFASIGLLLVVTELILNIPQQLKLARFVTPAAGLVLFAFTTALRAQEWSNPLSLAYAEAGKNPQSPRALYELGRVLIIASGYKLDSPFTPEAVRALNAARILPGASTLPEAGLLLLANHTHQKIDSRWLQDMAAKLRAHPISSEDLSALHSILNCQLRAECLMQPQEMLTLFLAALDHPNPPSRLLGIYSDFAVGELHDYALAEQLLRQAIAKALREDNYKIALVHVLQLEGKTEEATALLKDIN